VLPEKNLFLTKKSDNILQLQTTISFKMEHISMQVMRHLCSKNTIP